MKSILTKLALIGLIMSMLLIAAGCASNAPAPATTTAPAATTAPAVEPAPTVAKPEASASAETVTVRFSWWGSEARHSLTLQVIDLYKASHPNVDFQVEYLSGPDYNSKLATQAATKQLPDLFQTDFSWITTYTSQDLIGDLQPYLDNGAIDATHISANVMAAGKGSDGQQFAIPLGLNTSSMLYDPAVFVKAGYDSIPFNWTWEDYDTILTDVYKKTGIQALPLYYHIPEVLAETVARQAGKAMFTPDGKALGFDASDILPMFQRILDLTEASVYAPPDQWSTSVTTENNGLVLGKNWTAYGGSNQLVSYASTAGREIAITSVPYAGTVQGSFVKPSMMISINKNSQENVKAAAADFINFFVNDPEAAKILSDERGVPVNSANRDAVAATLDETRQSVFEYVAFIDENAAPPPAWAPSKAREVYSLLVDLYQAVAFKTVTPGDAANRFVEEANVALAAQ